jgi:lipid-binding SYLF domain-containing protein
MQPLRRPTTKLSAEIYSYSTTKGLFAGINLAYTNWEVGAKANQAVFGLAPASCVYEPDSNEAAKAIERLGKEAAERAAGPGGP